MQALDQLQSLDELRSALKDRHMVPGWEKQSRPLFTPEMRSEYDPGHWRYAQVHAAMLSAGRLIDTELAERRIIQDWVVRPLLRSIPGVAEINSQGGYVRQYQALVKPDRLTHYNVTIQQVWGGPNSGLDGGNDGGKGITDTPGGLKLQNEGHDVRYRNIWIRELNLKKADTRF